MLRDTPHAIRQHLAEHFSLNEVEVLLTDSTSRPLRLGVTGVALAHSGFDALHDYVSHPDIFGHAHALTKVNIRDGLAAAVLVMGEADAQTPLALFEDLPFVTFHGRNPTEEELVAFRISIEDDLDTPLLTSALWQAGGQTLDTKSMETTSR